MTHYRKSAREPKGVCGIQIAGQPVAWTVDKKLVTCEECKKIIKESK